MAKRLTNKDRLLSILRDMGLEPTIVDSVNKNDGTREVELVFYAMGQPKVTGYQGFVASFIFNEAGDLRALDIYE